MPRKTRVILTNLKSKGFEEKSKGDHIFLLYRSINGKKTRIFTKISFSIKEYGDSLLGPMSKQLRLTKDKLLELIDCPLDQQGYEAILKSQSIF